MDENRATRRSAGNPDEEQNNRQYKPGSGRITFRINLVRLWQLIAVAAIVLAVVFCTLWLNSSKNNNEETENTPLFFSKIKNADLPETQNPAEQQNNTEDKYNPNLDVSGVSINGKKIIIDPGHGGAVPGGTTGVSGKREKDVNLEISLKLKNLLESEGAEVIMTRDTDTALGDTWEADMQARENIILQSNADMFLSIHQNEFEDESASGPQVFFVQQGSVGKRLAVCVQDMLNYELDIESPRIALEAAYRVLKPGSQPSCTVECGFMSNPEEDLKLQDDAYQNKVAQAITDGIKLYVKQYG